MQHDSILPYVNNSNINMYVNLEMLNLYLTLLNVSKSFQSQEVLSFCFIFSFDNILGIFLILPSEKHFTYAVISKIVAFC